jgi:hypothetical protein
VTELAIGAAVAIVFLAALAAIGYGIANFLNSEDDQ